MTVKKKRIYILGVIATVIMLAATACGPAATPAPTTDPAVIQTQSAQTVVAGLTQSAPPPTAVPPPTAAPTAVPPPPGPTPDPNVPVAVVPTAAAGEPGAIADYNTLIYSGPGNNYVVYASLLGGVTVKVVGKSADGLWWAVSVPVAPAGTGWVDAAWVSVANVDSVPVLDAPPVPETVDIVPPEADDPQAVTLANVYVRTGPATNFPAYGIAPAGVSARVIGKSEDSKYWVVRLNPAKVGTGFGWVDAAFTQASNVEGIQVIKSPVSAVTEPPPPPPSDGSPAATTIDYVNVRSGPGTNYPVLVVAPAGVTGEVAGKSADGLWWQVKISTTYSSSGFGWVSSSYVVVSNVDGIPVVDVPPPPEVAVTPPPATTTGCSLQSQNPPDGTDFTPGVSFDTTWVLLNTGSETWTDDSYDIAYVGAVSNIAFHLSPDLNDLNAAVEPGWTYNFTVDMLSPSTPGSYGELWQVQSSGVMICQFYVYIDVP